MINRHKSIFYLEVVFELESLATIEAFEATEDGGFVMGDHVPLQAVHVGKLFSAHFALLQNREIETKNIEKKANTGITSSHLFITQYLLSLL
jgi:hypothetical protein